MGFFGGLKWLDLFATLSDKSELKKILTEYIHNHFNKLTWGASYKYALYVYIHSKILVLNVLN